MTDSLYDDEMIRKIMARYYYNDEQAQRVRVFKEVKEDNEDPRKRI